MLNGLRTWDEVYEVFGDGHDFDWALVAEEDMDEFADEEAKKDLRLEDVRKPTIRPIVQC